MAEAAQSQEATAAQRGEHAVLGAAACSLQEQRPACMQPLECAPRAAPAAAAAAGRLHR